MHQSSFDLYSVEGAIIFYSIVFLCVYFFFFFPPWDGSSMLMKSAMLLDLEFQHEIPFLNSYFLIPFTPIFCDSSTFPLVL